MTHHAIDTLTDSGLGQEVRTAVKWINDLSDEIGRRGLTLRLGLDPCIRIDDGGGKACGPYVEATVMKEVA